MKVNPAGSRFEVSVGGESLMSSSGAALLLRTAALSGLAGGVSDRLSRWRGQGAAHDPSKVVLDLAVAVALGGDCLADVAVLRAQPELFGLVASDPTVSRLVETLAADSEAAVAAIRAARAGARARVWAQATGRNHDGDHRT